MAPQMPSAPERDDDADGTIESEDGENQQRAEEQEVEEGQKLEQENALQNMEFRSSENNTSAEEPGLPETVDSVQRDGGASERDIVVLHAEETDVGADRDATDDELMEYGSSESGTPGAEADLPEALDSMQGDGHASERDTAVHVEKADVGAVDEDATEGKNGGHGNSDALTAMQEDTKDEISLREIESSGSVDGQEGDNRVDSEVESESGVAAVEKTVLSELGDPNPDRQDVEVDRPNGNHETDGQSDDDIEVLDATVKSSTEDGAADLEVKEQQAENAQVGPHDGEESPAAGSDDDPNETKAKELEGHSIANDNLEPGDDAGLNGTFQGALEENASSTAGGDQNTDCEGAVLLRDGENAEQVADSKIIPCEPTLTTRLGGHAETTDRKEASDPVGFVSENVDGEAHIPMAADNAASEEGVYIVTSEQDEQNAHDEPHTVVDDTQDEMSKTPASTVLGTLNNEAESPNEWQGGKRDRHVHSDNEFARTKFEVSIESEQALAEEANSSSLPVTGDEVSAVARGGAKEASDLSQNADDACVTLTTTDKEGQGIQNETNAAADIGSTLDFARSERIAIEQELARATRASDYWTESEKAIRSAVWPASTKTSESVKSDVDNVPCSDASALFELMDANGSGELEWSELRAALDEDLVREFIMERPHLHFLLRQTDWWRTLRSADTDQDGKLTLEELDMVCNAAASSHAANATLLNDLTSRYAAAVDRENECMAMIRGEHEAALREAEEELASIDGGSEALHMFRLMDTDGHGTVRASTFIRAVERNSELRRFVIHRPYLHKLLRPQTFSEAFREADTDGSGELSLLEFGKQVGFDRERNLREAKADAREHQEASLEVSERGFKLEARALFRMVDSNHDNRVSRSELIHAIDKDERVRAYLAELPHLHPLLQRQHFAEVFWAADTDKNGTIEFDEFFDMCRRLDAFATTEVKGAKINRVPLHRASYTLADGSLRELRASTKGGWSPSGVLPVHVRLFALIDERGAGKVSRAQLVRAIDSDARVRNFLIERPHMHPLLRPGTFAEAFRCCDLDGSGTIDLDEFAKVCALASSNVPDQSKPKSDEKMKSSGGVEYVDAAGFRHRVGEHLNPKGPTISRPIHLYPAEPLTCRIFRYIDRNEDGQISRAEIVNAIEHDDRVITFIKARPHLHDLLRPQTFYRAFQTCDIDEDGTLSMLEFDAMCLDHIPLKLGVEFADADGGVEFADADGADAVADANSTDQDSNLPLEQTDAEGMSYDEDGSRASEYPISPSVGGIGPQQSGLVPDEQKLLLEPLPPGFEAILDGAVIAAAAARAAAATEPPPVPKAETFDVFAREHGGRSYTAAKRKYEARALDVSVELDKIPLSYGLCTPIHAFSSKWGGFDETAVFDLYKDLGLMHTGGDHQTEVEDDEPAVYEGRSPTGVPRPNDKPNGRLHKRPRPGSSLESAIRWRQDPYRPASHLPRNGDKLGKGMSLERVKEYMTNEISANCGPKKVLPETRKLFDLLDLDRNGKIQAAEFIRAVARDVRVLSFLRDRPFLHPLLNAKTFTTAFRCADVDNSGEVTLEEFDVVIRAAAEDASARTKFDNARKAGAAVALTQKAPRAGGPRRHQPVRPPQQNSRHHKQHHQGASPRAMKLVNR